MWAGLLVVGFFLQVAGMLYANGGVFHAGDSEQYIGSADNVLHGLPPVGFRSAYIGYVMVVATFKFLGLGLPGVVAFQVVLALVTAMAVFDLGRKAGGMGAGYMAAALFLWNPDVVRWHVYILSDSTYMSMVVLTVWSAHRATERRTPGALAIALVLLCAATLIRPHGWVLPPAVFGSWAILLPTSQWKRAFFLGAVVVTFLLLMVCGSYFKEKRKEATDSVQRLFCGHVFGAPPNPWAVSMPVSMPGDDREVARYILRHPLACAKLGLARIGAEVVHGRPYFSVRHNLFIVVVYPALYLLALWSCFRLWRTPLVLLVLMVATGHSGVVALTFADIDGRTVLYMYALLAVLASLSLARLVGRTDLGPHEPAPSAPNRQA
ncbi:MAG: hypothetical protein A3K19_12925 [Lentisphaerae bacterium RIFOXYB12_FULL_65_16]|nr:MAG: hypothetical protein A3K18_04780 [Lentisphaerae bacterium RIFOXYA12_64_32]OGV87215.1 MAG: hypothetical protein A3K19_12925 [Lentisphaerae bacterium RIFOXYB12_FULL_65_16]